MNEEPKNIFICLSLDCEIDRIITTTVELNQHWKKHHTISFPDFQKKTKKLLPQCTLMGIKIDKIDQQIKKMKKMEKNIEISINSLTEKKNQIMKIVETMNSYKTELNKKKFEIESMNRIIENLSQFVKSGPTINFLIEEYQEQKIKTKEDSLFEQMKDQVMRIASLNHFKNQSDPLTQSNNNLIVINQLTSSNCCWSNQKKSKNITIQNSIAICSKDQFEQYAMIDPEFNFETNKDIIVNLQAIQQGKRNYLGVGVVDIQEQNKWINNSYEKLFQNNGIALIISTGGKNEFSLNQLAFFIDGHQQQNQNFQIQLDNLIKIRYDCTCHTIYFENQNSNQKVIEVELTNFVKQNRQYQFFAILGEESGWKIK